MRAMQKAKRMNVRPRPSPMAASPEDAAAIVGGYGELSYDSEAWLATGGLRLDYSGAFNGHRRDYVLATGLATLEQTPENADEIVPSARFGVRWRVGAADLRAAGYSSFRPPNLNELHRPFRVGNDTTLANPALHAERLYGAELGAGGDDWGVTIFYNTLDDAIGNVTLSSDPNGSTRQRRNLGRIDAVGLEAEASWRLGAVFDLRAGLAATDAEVAHAPEAQQLEGLRPAQAPELAVSFGAVWRIAPRFMLTADARWESARFDDDLNTRRLSPALNVDARLSFQITPRARLELAAENLLDGDIETAETADGIESFAPERRLSLGLAVR